MIGRVDIGIGSPKYDGLYVAEVFHGWKLLEWHKGEWWHPERVSRWTADVPPQWVGPLPVRKYPQAPGPVQEFDL